MQGYISEQVQLLWSRFNLTLGFIWCAFLAQFHNRTMCSALFVVAIFLTYADLSGTSLPIAKMVSSQIVAVRYSKFCLMLNSQYFNFHPKVGHCHCTHIRLAWFPLE